MDEQVRCLSNKHVPMVMVVLWLFSHRAQIAGEKTLLDFASDTKCTYCVGNLLTL